MKLQQLAIGARFEYDGRVYVKTGPLTAASEQGGQALIPRYAVLTPLDGREAPARMARDKLDAAAVHLAFDAFCQTCEALVASDNRAALASARERFLAALK